MDNQTILEHIARMCKADIMERDVMNFRATLPLANKLVALRNICARRGHLCNVLATTKLADTASERLHFYVLFLERFNPPFTYPEFVRVCQGHRKGE